MVFLSDLRLALRAFSRTPWLTTTLVVITALGAGGNAAIFGFIGGLMSAEVAGTAGDAAWRFGRVGALLAGASGLVLFLAASTVAGLLLARARSRSHELAVRLAVGASRWRLMQLCLADAVVIMALGLALGIAVGWWATNLFPLLFFAQDADQLTMSPDATWLLVAGGVWLLVLLLAALAPVTTISSLSPWAVLREETRNEAGGTSAIVRNRMAIGQVAVCSLLVLLAGAIRDDLRSTLRTAKGLGLGDVLVTRVEGQRDYLDAVTEAIATVPGVTNTAWLATLPAGEPATASFTVEPPMPRTRELRFDALTLDPDAFGVENLAPVAGRGFRGGDTPGGCPVAMINQAAADRYFTRSPVGQVLEWPDGKTFEVVGVLPTVAASDGESRPALYFFENQLVLAGVQVDAPFYAIPEISPTAGVLGVNLASAEAFKIFADPPIDGRIFDGRDALDACQVGVLSEDGAAELFNGNAVGGALLDASGARIEIIGVVQSAPLSAAQRAAPPTLTRPMAQVVNRRMTMAVQVDGVNPERRAAIAEALLGVPGGAALGDLSTFEEHLEQWALAPERIAALLITVLAGIALAVSISGIHGTMTDLVVRRRPELALRIALGARAPALVAEVVRAGMRLAVIGVAVGGGAAMVATLFLGTTGETVLPSPAVLLGAAGAVLLLVASSCAIPAWRAVSVDPREVIR